MTEETFLNTPRLTIRRFVAADAAGLAAYRRDPDVARYQSWTEFSEADAQAFIARIAAETPGTPGEWFQFALALRATGELVGDIGLKRSAEDPALADIGYTLARAHWGQGLASEAVRAVIELAAQWGVRRVQATVDDRNLPSLALARRLGMRQVGVVESIWRDAPCVEQVFELP